VFGLPSLRLRGLYLAVSTLALHFVVVYVGGEYETRRGFSTGILVNPPAIGGTTAAAIPPTARGSRAAGLPAGDPP